MVATATDLAARLIQHYESCVLHPYHDARGVVTIGWGNTRWEDGVPVTIGIAPISQDRADALFKFWLNKFVEDTKHYVPGANNQQLAAFTSLAYNIGEQAFSHSTALRQFLLSNTSAAGDAIELWDRAGNHVLLGLQRRRRAEHLVFKGEEPDAAVQEAEEDFAS